MERNEHNIRISPRVTVTVRDRTASRGRIGYPDLGHGEIRRGQGDRKSGHDIRRRHDIACLYDPVRVKIKNKYIINYLFFW